MPKTALLLINRKARSGEAAFDQVLAALNAADINIVNGSDEGNGQLSQTILRHKHEVDLVILGGGDGTLNAALDGLVRANLPAGVIPLGTANDFARTLAIPNDVATACEVILAGHTRQIDVGQVNGKHFLNVASLGLSVAISRSLNKEEKSRWGILAYLKTALQVVIRAKPFHAEISTAGRKVRIRTVQIAVGNGRHYGGGLTVSQDAEIDDAMLDLYGLEVQHWWQVIGLVPALRAGTLENSKHAMTLRGKSFEVTTGAKRFAVNTDGEVTTHTPATFEIVPKALTVFAPPPTAKSSSQP